MTHALRSSLLTQGGFEHAFNLRTGGASVAPYESFNLGRAVGDSAAHVAENHRRFAALVGYEEGRLYEVSQVHGAAVERAPTDRAPEVFRAREADALVAPRGGVAVGVRVADCAPVLLADPTAGNVAAVHAGWRGTVAGVLEAAVTALAEMGSEAGALRAAIFPHIRQCCFEVGEDVAVQLQGAAPQVDVVDRSRARPHVDLTSILLAKLRVLGVAEAHIDDVPGCTRCEPERFFSFRRDGARSGRHLAAIVSR